jgi:hypothetical protein
MTLIDKVCEICGREETLSRHHVIPRHMYKILSPLGYKLHSEGQINRQVCLCRECHDYVERRYINHPIHRELMQLKAYIVSSRIKKATPFTDIYRFQLQAYYSVYADAQQGGRKRWQKKLYRMQLNDAV